jgi:type IV secretion system protein VirB6
MLGSVSCNTQDLAHRGYEALTGGAAFQSGLTVVLTIYVALVGYRLLFASEGARLADAPRMALKIGVVLALVGSWGLFETLVFDVAAKAPVQIAELIALGSAGGSGEHRDAPDPVGRLQVAYDQLAKSAAAFGASAAANSQTASQAPVAQPAPSPTPSAMGVDAPPDAATAKAEAAARSAVAARALTAAGGAVLTVDAGLIAVTALVVGVLTAIGPIFVTLFLFRQTRGFFEGWVRALVAAALGSLGGWALILLMLGALEPWLVILAQQRQLKVFDPSVAMTAASIVFVFTVAQLALVAAGAVVSFGFRLTFDQPLGAGGSATSTAGPDAYQPPIEMMSRTGLLADQLRRFDSVFEARTRAGATAAGAGSMRLAAVGAPAPIWPGDDERRSSRMRDFRDRRGDRR